MQRYKAASSIYSLASTNENVCETNENIFDKASAKTTKYKIAPKEVANKNQAFWPVEKRAFINSVLIKSHFHVETQ